MAVVMSAQQAPAPAGGGGRQGGAQAPAAGGARQGGAQPGAPAAGGGRAGGGRGGGGGGGGAAVTGFGTTNTLYTIPESGQGSAAMDPTAEQLAASPEAQTIIANAKRMAGNDPDLMREVERFCTWNASANVPPSNSPETVQVFDNVWLATTGGVSAWIIRTSAGIILWDTLNSEADATNIIEAGMKKFGLNPADIRIIVIGHHHNDHTGGLAYFQRMYNPTIYMGKLDWDVMMASTTAARLRRGEDVRDGQKVTLGDTTITLFLLPGHTPGSVSGIFSGRYQGRQVNILNLTASRFSSYASLAPFQRIFDEGKRAKVEAVVQVHPEINMLKTATIQGLRTWPVSGAHPLLWSPEKTARYMDVELECGRARIAANKHALDQARGPEYYRTPDPPAPAPAAAAPAAAPAGGRGGRGAGRAGGGAAQ
jgi:metallo-beta-lactamase class B